MVQILNGGDDLANAHASCIEEQDLVIHGRKSALMLLHQLGFKAAFAITRRVHFKLAIFGNQDFTGVAVAAIWSI